MVGRDWEGGGRRCPIYARGYYQEWLGQGLESLLAKQIAETCIRIHFLVWGHGVVCGCKRRILREQGS